jgi:hypothetical protein
MAMLNYQRVCVGLTEWFAWNIPYAPWCWYIYLQNWVIYEVNVGKCSSTMDPFLVVMVNHCSYFL